MQSDSDNSPKIKSGVTRKRNIMLTPRLAAAILCARDRGVPVTHIAAALGVASRRIYAILANPPRMTIAEENKMEEKLWRE